MCAGPSSRAVWGLSCLLLLGCSGASIERSIASATSSASSRPTPAEAPSPDPVDGSTRLRFHASDGVRLDGRLFGNGTVGVVLAHQVDNDQSAWYPFAHRLATRGYRALTFDFRGYCPGGIEGCSSGNPDLESSWKDVAGAVRALREMGVRHVSLIGASVGGQAVIETASRSRNAIAGIVSLSAPEFFAYDLTRRVLASVSAPALFVAGRGDGDAADSAQDFYRWSTSGARDVLVLDTSAHGTDLLADGSPSIAHAVDARILAFLERYGTG